MFFVARGNIPDDRLAALIHMHMLDADQLRSPGPPRNLALHGGLIQGFHGGLWDQRGCSENLALPVKWVTGPLNPMRYR